MNVAMAQEMVRLAAPIYAAMLGRALLINGNVPAEMLSEFRRNALIQAVALWQDALEIKL